MCRKHHGSAFATFVVARAQGFSFVAGKDAIMMYASSEYGRRLSCTTCGSVAPIVDEEADIAILPAGNLEGELGVTPGFHAFVGSKAIWYTIADELPRYDEYPPDYGASAVSGPQVDRDASGTRGSCLCGSVTYAIDGAVLGMRHCHCSRCRRGRSAAHVSNLFCAMDQLHILTGGELIKTYKVPEALRFTVGFCVRCGGAAPHVSPERNWAIIPAGTLDTDPGVRPKAHIFVGAKAPWFTIRDGLPQYAEQEPT
jgi:hypothetical protein